MSNAERRDEGEKDGSAKGLNLTLVYSLIGLALLAAITIAVVAVLPFYQRR